MRWQVTVGIIFCGIAFVNTATAADDLFSRLDVNKDDKVSREELPDRQKENFGRIDAEVAKLNTEAVAAREKQGLKGVKVDPAAWRVVAEKSCG